jgi:hypothetical protein
MACFRDTRWRFWRPVRGAFNYFRSIPGLHPTSRDSTPGSGPVPHQRSQRGAAASRMEAVSAYRRIGVSARLEVPPWWSPPMFSVRFPAKTAFLLVREIEPYVPANGQRPRPNNLRLAEESQWTFGQAPVIRLHRSPILRRTASSFTESNALRWKDCFNRSTFLGV